MKRANKDAQPRNFGQPSAEPVERRSSTKGNSGQATAGGTQGPQAASSELARVREAARRDAKQRFTNLLHHVSIERLREAYWALKRQAAPGVDGVTWVEYGEGLEERLVDLQDRIQSERYRAKPSKRAWVPKPDGRQRPLGIAALEDKIVQQALVWVLQAIYEEDFLGFSYESFRDAAKVQKVITLWAHSVILPACHACARLDVLGGVGYRGIVADSPPPG